MKHTIIILDRISSNILGVCFFIILSAFSGFSQRTGVEGIVTDSKGEPLPFVNVFINGTSKGTSTNFDGNFFLSLENGKYELVIRNMGYKTEFRNVEVSSGVTEMNVNLASETKILEAVVVESDGEDPAYWVIRNAIKMRKIYLKEIDGYSCHTYTKDVNRITQHPKKILGKKLDSAGVADLREGMGIIDTNENIIFLSESESEYHFRRPFDEKDILISSRVSGDNSEFSYGSNITEYYNFYKNVLEFGELSERGFVSPISNNALFYYRYKLLGTFFEDGRWVNKIKVTPKRKTDPTFSGIIYITEGAWRIHSLNLKLSKDAKIDFIDSLRIIQTHMPVKDTVWKPVSINVKFYAKLMGFEITGDRIGISSNYALNPEFPKKFFNGEVYKVQEGANEKDSGHWEENRPVPLTKPEEEDYRMRDSLQRIYESKPYLDSLDSLSNKFTPMNLLTGYTYYNRAEKKTFTYSSLLNNFSFNTVQGFNLGIDLSYRKELDKNRYKTLSSTIRYGFSNERVNGTLSYFKFFDAVKLRSIDISGGLSTVQFNSSQPISSIVNMTYSLLDKQNYMKLFEKAFGLVSYRTEIINGLNMVGTLSYEDRSPLFNTTDYSLLKRDVAYSSNNPVDLQNDSAAVFSKHQALNFTFGMTIRIKQKYYTEPNKKVLLGSKYPTLNVMYKKGVNKLLGADTDFDLVQVSVSDRINFKLLGRGQYNVTVGRFLNNKSIPFTDYHHFNGNQTVVSGFGLSQFNLLPYYEFSTSKEYVEAYYKHSFGGMFLNKIPLINKLKLREVAGVNFLATPDLPSYAEIFVGLEKLRRIRLDFVMGLMDGKQVTSGFRFGVNLN